MLGEVHHRVTALRQAVSPLLDAVGKLFGGRVPPVCEPRTEYFRDIADNLARLQISIDRGEAFQTPFSLPYGTPNMALDALESVLGDG